MPAGTQQVELHSLDPGCSRSISFCTCSRSKGDRHVRLLLISEDLMLTYRRSGAGASCIYPLLGCRVSPSWNFVATGYVDPVDPCISSEGFFLSEIDQTSYECASINITSNGLQSRIHLHKAQPHEPILSPLLGSDTFDFMMCNPPFYSSKEEIEKSKREKEFSPSAVCTGADTEMITPGGESAFIRQIVAESLTHRTKCRYRPLTRDFRPVC